MALNFTFTPLCNPISISCFPNPNTNVSVIYYHRRNTLRLSAICSNPLNLMPQTSQFSDSVGPKLYRTFLQFAAASAIFCLGLVGGRACCAAAAPLVPVVAAAEDWTMPEHKSGAHEGVEKMEDGELQASFERWKSKEYALTVPLRVVALAGSVPPSWLKDFLLSQGRRSRLCTEFRGSLNDIFSAISMPSQKGSVGPKSDSAADLITLGDPWLSSAIEKALIEPIQGVEDEDWFKCLSDKWKIQIFLRRNNEGKIDSEGKLWAVPYRWGSMVIAYKKNKFQKHKLDPVEDWADLWRPDLAGKISMVDSPREVIGAVLKYMGTSYNVNDIGSQVAGGREAARQNLIRLQKQVRVFDSVHYLKAFGVGDVWVAVGWSSDVLPVAKRMSNVAVVVPKSGASLWADLWAIPVASKVETSRIGGRVRGASPLIYQWIEFCLQAARAVPFKQEVVPGASPAEIEGTPVRVSFELPKGRAKLNTNLIAGVPPPDILARCEFLEPLSDAALADYKWLIASTQSAPDSLFDRFKHSMFSIFQMLWPRLQPKVP
ncbi:hypothetical protein RJ641_000772 [Dillenia turbinata]|uniref:Uncharacterized protein n=1 Tax=Dillenia turbinata TaxID=194707 RepID=A0AAN8WCJ5_9MAGN